MPRSILITGCSSGIGQCAALGMQARGWQVFATARKPEDIDALKAAGVTALYLDYTEPDSIAAAADAVFAATGGTLDALFNNGAYGQPGALEDVSTDVLRAQFEANFFGWHDLTRRVDPRDAPPGPRPHRDVLLGARHHRDGFSRPLCRDEVRARSLFRCAADRACRIRTSTSRSSSPGRSARTSPRTRIAHARKNIDLENSVHAAYYRRRLRSMEKGGNTFGELGPEAVLEGARQSLREQEPAPAIFRDAADLRHEPAPPPRSEAPAPRFPAPGRPSKGGARHALKPAPERRT